MPKYLRAVLAATILCASLPAIGDNLVEEVIRARQAYDQSNWEEALERYRLLKEKAPGNGEIHFRLGNVYARLGKFDEAAQAYQEFLAREPHPKGLHNLGVVRIRQAMAALSFAAEMESADLNGASQRLLDALETALEGPVQTPVCPPEPEPMPPPLVTPDPLEAFTTSRVHLRQGRGPDHARLTTLAAGTPLSVLARQDGFGLVRTADGIEGWLPLFLLRLGVAPSVRNAP